MFMFAKETQEQMQPKYGLLKIGDCILANNNSQIPQQDLRKIYRDTYDSRWKRKHV